MSDTMIEEVPPSGWEVAPEAERPTTVEDMAEPAIGPIRIGPKGRVVLPIEARRELGLNEGDELLVLLEDDMIKLVTRDRLLKLIQDDFANYPGSLVDDLLAERRAAARREREEIDAYVADWEQEERGQQ
jgi:AbrB family transcriptional regulator, stage V sporulation protein T